MERQQEERIREQLETARQELVGRRMDIEDSRANLQQDQVEMEERAASQQMSDSLEQLDGQGEVTIAAINRALTRLDEGEYGQCEECGEQISFKRLQVLPWAERCIECAENREQQAAAPVPPAEEEDLPSRGPSEELQGMSDRERVAALSDALVRDGGVDADDLRITSENGRLRLEGALPNKAQRSKLEQIVYDSLGFAEVDWEVRIDRTAWARADRTPGIDREEERPPDTADGSGAETIDSVKEGKSMRPADEIIPEKKEGTE